MTYITLRWAFWRMLRHRIRNKGRGSAVRGGGGHGRGSPWRDSPVSPVPESIGAGDVTQANVFSGLRGRLMQSYYWELLFLHWEERGWVKLQRTGRKLECIPQW